MRKLIFLFTISLTLSCCNNDDDNNPQNPIDQLPPATQTGENTFGCLLDGEPFLPPNFGNYAPSAFYQFVDGAYTLGLSARDNNLVGLESIIIGGIDVPSILEINYPLKSFNSGNYYGLYDLVYQGNPQTYYTTEETQGRLTINNFDPDNFIISGTFEFTVLDNEGNEIHITDGRFDMNYTN